MSKKPIDPSELRMPAEQFDAMMRKALGVPFTAPRDAVTKDDQQKPKLNAGNKSGSAKQGKRSTRV